AVYDSSVERADRRWADGELGQTLVRQGRPRLVARVLANLDLAQAGFMHHPADDIDAVEADVLQVDPEVAELHLEVLRIGRHQDQAALGLQGFHRSADQALARFRPQRPDEVG